MNLKKALALLLALTLCLGMFAACAAKTEAPAEDGSTSQPAAAPLRRRSRRAM